MTLAPTFTTVPATALPPTKILTPTEPPTKIQERHCRELCKEEFWEGGPTISSVQAEFDAGAGRVRRRCRPYNEYAAGCIMATWHYRDAITTGTKLNVQTGAGVQ